MSRSPFRSVWFWRLGSRGLTRCSPRGAKKAAQPPKAETPATKETRQDRLDQDRASQERRDAENRGPQGHRSPRCLRSRRRSRPRSTPRARPWPKRSSPPRTPGWSRLDRPAADPRHPDHRPRDRHANPEEHDGQEALRRQPRGLRRVVHGLRQAGGDQLRGGRPDHQPQRRASSSGTISARGSWSNTSRRSARPRARPRRQGERDQAGGGQEGRRSDRRPRSPRNSRECRHADRRQAARSEARASNLPAQARQ